MILMWPMSYDDRATKRIVIAIKELFLLNETAAIQRWLFVDGRVTWR
jgi:hypothetical protein